ncbi:MAG: TRAP transporter large permease, partial [Pseudomonadota bacterium]|nr:TRAP transporter large permease [Pseudomonadota bacterium]
MELTVLFGSFLVLLVLGVPIAFVLAISSLATVMYMGLPPLIVFQRMGSGMNVFALMAIPFFIYAGDLMLRGAIAEKLVRLAAALVGHVRGGLGVVNVASSTFFGGVSGSAVADAAAVGALMVPQMQKRGYAVDYAVNVTVTSAVIALIIPPSHNMIIYSISAGGTISIADLFTAGIVPGLLLAGVLMLTAYIVARRRGYPAEAFPGWAAALHIFIVALPGLLLILIIVGGVRSGYFTATESSLIAVVYALLVTLLVYRSLSWNDFVAATLGAVRTTAMVLLVIGAAAAFGWLLALLQVPAAMIALMQQISDNPLVIFLLINVILLMLGCFMDMSPLIIITTPIFLPVVKAFGMDPVHFGVI